MSMITVETTNISKHYGKTIAIENLNLSIMEGELIGFLGPNGAGKTTTIRLLMGLITPTSGQAVIKGIPTAQKFHEISRIVGYLPENAGFYDNLSVFYNLEFFGRLYLKQDLKNQIEKYLKEMDLWHKKDDKAGTLSKGMRQKLAIARALLHEPEIIILDEPTSGLDPEAAINVRELIKSLHAKNRTIIISSHNLTEVEEMCNRVALIKNKLITLSSIADLKAIRQNRQIVVKLESDESGVFEAVSRSGLVNSIERKTENEFLLDLKAHKDTQSQIIELIMKSGGKISSIYEKEDSLEDIYLKLVKNEGEVKF